MNVHPLIKKSEKFFDQLEAIPISFGLWMATAIGLVIARDFFESILSFQATSKVSSFHLAHFPIFFLSLLLAVILLLHFFSRVDILKTSRMSIFFFGVILLPILVDSAIKWIDPQNVLYVYVEKDLWRHFLYFFYLPVSDANIPYGIRLEIMSIVFTSFIYIYVKRRNFLWSLFGSLCVYFVCFIAISLPALVGLIHAALSRWIPIVNLGDVVMLLNSSNFDMGLRLVSIVQLMLLTLFAGIWYWRYDARKCQALLSNVRVTRCLHYILLMVFGMVVHYCFHPTAITTNISLIRFAAVALALFFAFQFSVVTNDVVDLSADKISNQQRPLVANIFSSGEYLSIGFVYLALSLLFAFQAGDAIFMLVLAFIVFYFIYSIPPLHLKRFFILSNIMIGLEAVVAVWIGYVFRQDIPVSLSALFPEIFWGIFFIFFLVSSVKDLKDIDGDKSAGVVTLPIVVGRDRAFQVVGTLVLISYLLMPLFLYRMLDLMIFILVFFAGLFMGAMSFFYMKQGKITENMIFVLYFIYFVFICGVLLAQAQITQARLPIGF